MTPKTKDKWLAIIRQFQSSSLSIKAFTDQQGLNYLTFRNYYYRLRQLIDQDKPLSFLPVVLDQSSPFQNHARVSILLPGPITLQLGTLPPPQYLKELLLALREV